MKNIKNKKLTVLVTGGAGFIGAHLSKRLMAAGYPVIIVDNLNDYYDPKLKRDRLNILLKGLKFVFYKVDITDRKALEKIFKKHKIGIICHLAAQPGVRHSLIDPWVYGATNVQGTINLMELAKNSRVNQFILASSSSVYGEKASIPFSERYKIASPASLYGATKMATELIGYAYHQLYGLKICVLRFFTVYGPWGRPDMAYFKFADLMKKNKPIEIYNHGKMRRDFTYVDDIVAGVMSALKRNFTYEIINLGNDRPEELPRLIELLEDNLGVKAKKKYLPMQPGDVVNTWADIGKARKLLNYQPKTSLEQGIAAFAKWYKNYYKL